jgi:hypothetical protein
MTSDEIRRARIVRLVAFAFVTLVGLWLVWPVPLGEAPLSKDHTVHLTRAWMWAQVLADGAPRGYSETWFFGTPIGELYPILGDALVIAIRVLGLGLVPWHTAYALAFTIVFVSQGWVMLRLARACGLGVTGGLIAGTLVLVDAGAYREGGWIYTVDYGVWPQALAGTLSYLALAEIIFAIDSTTARARTLAIVRGAIATAGALLSHQISLPVLGLAGAIVVAVIGLRRRDRFGEIALVVFAVLGLGFALAAWWVLPMMSMRGWMVSYGWLWQSLEWMIDQALRGHLAQGMPVGTSALVALGVVLVAVRGTDGARAIVLIGVVLWVWTSSDTLWRLRLDLFDRSFGQMQWQRFLIASKPALFLAAGGAVALLVQLSRWLLARADALRWLAALPAASVIAMLVWTSTGQREVMRLAHVGEPQVAVDPEDPTLADDYTAMAEHLRSLREADAGPPWRVTVAAPRNLHWFMDLPVRSGVALYKQGFTPGDNFVHKPESDDPELLDRLGVRYVVTRRRASVRGAAVVATFGQLRLWERRSWQPVAAARTSGTATIEVVRDDGDEVVVRVVGSSPGDVLVFDAAGYPRWQLLKDGTEVQWYEVPAVGDGPIATIAERRRGDLLGGKAEGDDGTEPTLVAADAADGEWTLRYRVWRGADVFAMLVSLAAAFALGMMARQARRAADTGAYVRVQSWVAPRLRPWMLGAAIVLGGIVFMVRTGSARSLERQRAIGWVDAGDAKAVHAQARPLKCDMAIHPAVVVKHKPKRAKAADDARDRPKHPPAEVTFDAVLLGERLTGWYAIDDDAAKLRADGDHHLTIVARGPDGADVTLFDTDVRHRSGRVWIDVPTLDLAGTRATLVVTLTSEGQTPPEVGFDLDLGAPMP